MQRQQFAQHHVFRLLSLCREFNPWAARATVSQRSDSKMSGVPPLSFSLQQPIKGLKGTEDCFSNAETIAGIRLQSFNLISVNLLADVILLVAVSAPDQQDERIWHQFSDLSTLCYDYRSRCRWPVLIRFPKNILDKSSIRSYESKSSGLFYCRFVFRWNHTMTKWSSWAMVPNLRVRTHLRGQKRNLEKSNSATLFYLNLCFTLSCEIMADFTSLGVRLLKIIEM